MRKKVEHVPGDRDPKPVRMWSSRTGTTGADVCRRRQTFLLAEDLRRPWERPAEPRRPTPRGSAGDSATLYLPGAMITLVSSLPAME
nr:hypothetical protein [Streptomyces yerevanensis]